MRIVHLLCVLFCCVQSLFSQIPNNPLKISKLKDNFYIFTTWQTYKGNPVPANGMFVLTRAGVVMLDSPWDTTQCQVLLDSISLRFRQNVVFCLATHSHRDRTGGFNYYRAKGIPTWSYALTRDICRKTGEPQPDFVFNRDTVFQIGQYRFEALFPGKGHTIDNTVVWFPEDKILYGGCLVKSMEAEDLGYTGEADLKAWPKTMRRLKKRCKNAACVIPGHGDWNSVKALDHTINLLRNRPKE